MFRLTGRLLPFSLRLMSLALTLFLVAGCALAAGCDSPSDTTGTPTTVTTTASVTTAEPSPASTTQTTATTEPLPDDSPANPLTGEPLARAEAEGLRPVAVMINNHRSAVPQIGVGSADILCEMLVEGGITRLMAVFADTAAIPELGSIRSGRHDYIDLAGGFDAIYVHIGASYLANDQFSSQGTAHIDLHKYPDAYWRDPDWLEDRGYEHSVKSTGARIQAAIEKAGYRTTVREGQKTAFSFRTFGDFAAADGDSAVQVTVPYSDYCTATFAYDQNAKVYQKGQFGKDHIDLATGQPLQFTNIILVMTRVVVLSDGILKDAALEAGDGYYISGGQWQPISWKKGKTNDSFVFFDETGNELTVNPGKSYLGIVPDSRTIRFK